MGTNYYADQVQHGKVFTHHIGKASFGWPFIFNAARTPSEWREFLDDPMTSMVYDEYGTSWRASDLWRIIDGRTKELPPKADFQSYTTDENGYVSTKFRGDWS